MLDHSFIDDGASIDSNFYPDRDLDLSDEDEVLDFEEVEVPLYNEITEEKFDCCSHYNNAGWFSRMFFSWATPIIRVSQDFSKFV